MRRCFFCKHFFRLKYHNICKEQRIFLIPNKSYNDCEHYEPGLESDPLDELPEIFRGGKSEQS